MWKSALRSSGIWLGCTICLLACGEVRSRYRYISLEDVPGIQIDKTAKIDIDGLRDASAIPVEYRLVRERYTLHFSITGKSYHPAIRISPGDRRLRLIVHRDPEALAPNGAPCASSYPVAGGAIDFGWEPECTGAGLSKIIDVELAADTGTADTGSADTGASGEGGGGKAGAADSGGQTESSGRTDASGQAHESGEGGAIVIGRERIAFRLKENGFYTVTDSI